jgi:hypothetical protein
MARPSIYSPELAERVLDQLADGKSLRAICELVDMPSRPTVYKWVDANLDGFADRYARARDIGLDVVADEVLEIADAPVGSTDNGGTDSGAVADKRVRFDARRWYLSKLAPKRYGDKLSTEISGPDGGPVKAQIVIATGVPDDDWV